MKRSHFFILAMFFSAVILSQAAHAVNDPNAAVVKLRTSCEEVAGITLNNCFTTTSALHTWIDARPVTAGPLSVEIGPGRFSGPLSGAVFNCDKSNITLKGSGPDVTILDGGFSGLGIKGNSGCINFNVQDLTVTSWLFAILWLDNGGGSSRWTNVSVVTNGDGYAWSETCPGTGSNRAVHYWFNSRLSSNTKTYNVFCSENWFFGSEIMATGSGSSGQSVAFLVASQNTTAKPEVHVYGSVIRALAAPGVSYPTPGGSSFNARGILAVAAGRNAEFHVHGTGIDIISGELQSPDAKGNPVTQNGVAALVAWDGGKIHANEASYNLKTGTGGTVTRILKDTNPNTHVHAPYLWPEHDTPPNITSADGADMAVITTPNGAPKMVIYSTFCTINSTANSNWYDTVDKRCLPK